MQHMMDLKAIAHTRQLHKHILVKVKHQQTFLHQAEFLLLTHPVFVNVFFLNLLQSVPVHTCFQVQAFTRVDHTEVKVTSTFLRYFHLV